MTTNLANVAVTQREAFIESFTRLDRKDLGEGYSISVEQAEYKPWKLAQWFKGHEEGISLNIGVSTPDGKTSPVHSVKVWSTGFDSGMWQGAAHWERKLTGNFPYGEHGSVGQFRCEEEAKNVLRNVQEDVAIRAQTLFSKQEINPSPVA